MTFKPGVSGNPSGRPRVDKDVLKLARSHTKEAVATLAKLMKDPNENGAVRASAATALLDRGWGKPMQAVALAAIDPVRAEQLSQVVNELRGATFRRVDFINDENRRVFDAEIVDD